MIGAIGCETPRLFTEPLRTLTPATSRGYEAIQFASEVLGIDLMPWQRWLLIHALELRDDGHTYRFRTLLVLVARQNGKTTLMLVLALWRLYLDHARLVIGTAQNLDVAEEAWGAAVEMAEGVPELQAEIASVDKTNGHKALRLVTGERYKVASACRRGGRGLSGDLVLLDELREHRNWEAWAAVSKTTQAREKPQIWCLSNAGDDSSVVLNHLRDKAMSNPGGSLGLFEWSAVDGCELNDPAARAQANPALGHTIPEHALMESLETDPEPVYRTEVLCQRVGSLQTAIFPLWSTRAEPNTVAPDGARFALAVDTNWDRSMSYIAAAIELPDGRILGQLVASGAGTGWVPKWFADRIARKPAAIALVASGAPVSSVHDDLLAALPESERKRVRALNGTELAQAAGHLFDRVAEGGLVHHGQHDLDSAIDGAVSRPMAGGAWALDRVKSECAPAVALSEAVWALNTAPAPVARSAPRRLR